MGEMELVVPSPSASRGSGNARPFWVLLVGPAVFMGVWAAALTSGLRLDFARDRMMQFVGVDELGSVTFLEAWRSIHIQPPGFNMLLKFSDSLGPDGSMFWMLILLGITLVALWMVGDIVWQLTSARGWVICAGLVAALAPGTLYYSLWVFYTQVVAFLLVLMAWGLVAGLVRKSVGAFITACLGVVPLFLIRSTYVWVIAVAWIFVVVLLGRRSLGSERTNQSWFLSVAGIVGILAVLSVQAVSWTTFGNVSQSSWGYENTAKALMTQMTEEDLAAAAQGDLCLAEVVEVGVFKPIEEYPDCALSARPEDVTAGNTILDSTTWMNGFTNLNNIQRLALADQWRTFTFNALRDDPMSLARIPFPNFETQERGTIARFLWPSSWYGLIDGNVSAGGMASSVWILLFSWIPAVALIGVVLGLWYVRFRWRSGDPRRLAYRLVAACVVGISVMYLFLETGENERFRAEIDWLIIAVGVVGWHLTWVRYRARQSDEIRKRIAPVTVC